VRDSYRNKFVKLWNEKIKKIRRVSRGISLLSKILIGKTKGRELKDLLFEEFEVWLL
jgi:hypothetical protein